MKKYILLGLYISSIVASEDFFFGMTEQEKKEALSAQIAYERAQNQPNMEDALLDGLTQTSYNGQPAPILLDRSSDGESLLHIAAAQGFVKVIKHILDKKIELLNDKNFKGQAALHFASSKGHLDAVKLLLEYGADRDALDNSGHSPLYYACKHGQAVEMIYLLQNGAGDDKNCLQELLSEGGRAAINALLASRFMESNKELFDACKSGNLTLVIKKVEEDKCDLGNKDKIYCTPLHVASVSGKLNIVEYLVGAGANINAQTNLKMTPLHLAALRGHLDIVKFLVSNGADIEFVNSKGSLAIDIARQQNKVEVVAYLTTAKRDLDRYKETAAIAKKIEEEKTAISNKLIESCMSGNLEELKSLLAKGENINTKNSAGESLIHIASKHSHQDIVRFLFLEHPDLSDLGSWEPEHTYYVVEFSSILEEIFNSCKTGNLGSLKNLITELPNLNISRKGSNLLHVASKNGHLNIIELLVFFGADINIKDKKGRTPLHIACSKCNLAIVQYLVGKGALNNVLDKYNCTPLKYACENHQLDIVEYLVKLNPSLVYISLEKGYMCCLTSLTAEELKSLLIKLKESNIILSDRAVGKKHAENQDIFELISKSKK